MMEENGMSPTATSYSALLCGHTDRGDMDRVEQVSLSPSPPLYLVPTPQLVEEMREKRVFPSIGVYTAVMDRLSAGGHSDLLPRALNLIPDKQLIYHGDHGNTPHPLINHLLLQICTTWPASAPSGEITREPSSCSVA